MGSNRPSEEPEQPQQNRASPWPADAGQFASGHLRLQAPEGGCPDGSITAG